MSKPFYVTTPIYYVNGSPHIGSAYTTVLGDILARYHAPAILLTGTDEHGQKVAEAAAARGLTPIAHCDEVQQRFRDAWAKLDIQYHDFIRTTETRHTTVVQKLLQDLRDRGDIYVADYEGWYDIGAEVFVTEKEAAGNPNLRYLKESNYFFRMEKYREQLLAHVETHPDFIKPESRRNEVLSLLRKPTRDLCISRPKSRLQWGITLPFDKDYVTYVWFDALLNYYSADPKRWPADIHLIGKDILTTHTLYWGTMLLALGLEFPKTILAHGWWLIGGDKIAKSAGNAVDPLAFINSHGADAVRYFLASEMVVGQDAEFSEDRFNSRYNSDLANEWGNLLSRVLTMVQKYRSGVTPGYQEVLHSGPRETAEKAIVGLPERLRDAAVHLIAQDAMGVFRAANRLVDAAKPWDLAKTGQRAALDKVLYALVESLRIGALLLEPITPTKSRLTLEQLGNPSKELLWGSTGLYVTNPGPILFPKMDPANVRG